MKVVIFCGGQGTRIQGVADNLPKPMVKIGGKPILWHIMSIYAAYGFKDFVLCLGHLSWEIKEYFLNYRSMNRDFQVNLSDSSKVSFLNQDPCSDWNVVFAETGEDTQTGGRLRKVAPYIQEDKQVMVTYGDGVSNVNLKELVDFHNSHGKAGTITGVRPSGRFGEITYSDKGLINQFNEKPQTEAGRINGGFMIFNTKEMLSYLSTGDQIIFEREPMMNMVADKQLMVYRHNGFWQPMDTHREYKLLNDLWAKGDAPWKIW